MTLAEITGVEPQHGSRDGGVTVSAHGQHVAEITEVRVGDFGAVQPQHVSDTELTFVTPPSNIVGASDDLRAELTFHTADGTSVSPGWAFVYAGVNPQITDIQPRHGSREGGETVHLTGHHLTAITTIAVGDAGTATPQHVSDTELTFVSPNSNVVGPGPDLLMQLAFHTADGAMIMEPWMIFTYVGNSPTIAWVEPTAVHPAGGDVVQVGGVHLDHLHEVLVGDLPPMPLHPVSEGIVSFTMPALPADHPQREDTPMGVLFHVVDGSDLIWPNFITYTAGHLVVPALDHTPPASDEEAPTGQRPSIHLLQPATGPRPGGDWISITGRGLGNVVSVTFGGVPAHFEARTDLELMAYPPPFHESMGAPDVLVELHSHAHGVSVENVHYQYGAAAEETDRPGTFPGPATIASSGADIGSGTADEVSERVPQ